MGSYDHDQRWLRLEARVIQLLDDTEFTKLENQFKTDLLGSEPKSKSLKLQVQINKQLNLPEKAFQRGGKIYEENRSVILSNIFGTTLDQENAKLTGQVNVEMSRVERNMVKTLLLKSGQSGGEDLHSTLQAVRQERAQESFRSVTNEPNQNEENTKQAVTIQAAAVTLFRQIIDTTSNQTPPTIPAISSTETKAREMQMAVLFDTKKDLMQTPDVDKFGRGTFDRKASEAVANVAAASVLASGPLTTRNTKLIHKLLPAAPPTVQQLVCVSSTTEDPPVVDPSKTGVYTFGTDITFQTNNRIIVRIRRKAQNGHFGVTIGSDPEKDMPDLATQPLIVDGQKFRIFVGSLGVCGWVEDADPINRAGFRVKFLVPRGMLGQDIVLHTNAKDVWQAERAGVMQTHKMRRALVQITPTNPGKLPECVEGEIQFMVGTNRCILADVARAFGQPQERILGDEDLKDASVNFRYLCEPRRRLHLLYPDVCGEYRQPVFPSQVLDPLDPPPKRAKKYAQVLACIARSNICAKNVVYRCGKQFHENCTATFYKEGRFELTDSGGRGIQSSIGCRIFFLPDLTTYHRVP